MESQEMQQSELVQRIYKFWQNEFQKNIFSRISQVKKRFLIRGKKFLQSLCSL